MALRGISASTVFWERQCHYCRTVINIWLEPGSGVAWQCPIEYLCTLQLKVNGNPVKTLMAIKMDDAEWVIFASSPFPDPITCCCHCGKITAAGWQECQALDHTTELMWQYKSRELLAYSNCVINAWSCSCKVKKIYVCDARKYVTGCEPERKVTRSKHGQF